MFQIPQRDELDEAAEAALATAASDARPSDAARGRRRISTKEAEAIKRAMLGGFGRYFTMEQRREFLELYEVERGEPPPSPEEAYLESQKPKPPKDESRGMGAAIKRFLGVSAAPTTSPVEARPLTEEEKAERRRRTFFS